MLNYMMHILMERWLMIYIIVIVQYFGLYY